MFVLNANDDKKTTDELLQELGALRHQVVVLEAQAAAKVDREREAMYSELLERANDGVTILQDANFVYSNSRFAEIMGYTVEELLERPFADYVHPADVTLVKARYEQRLRGEDVPEVYESGLVHRDGRRIDVMLNAGIITFRGRKADFVFVRDITESKQAQKQAQRLLEQQIRLNRLALSFGQIAQLEEIYQTLAELVRELLPVDLLFISFYDEATQLIRAGYAYAYGKTLPVTDLPPLPLAPPGMGLQSQVIRTGQPIYVPDYLKTEAVQKTIHEVRSDGKVKLNATVSQVEDPVHSILYVPMKVGGHITGVLQIQSAPVDAYSPEDVEFLTAVANLAAVTIQNARLLAQTREQALQMEQIIDGVPEGVVRLDAHAAGAMANPAAQAYLAKMAGVQIGDVVKQLGERPLTDLLSSPPTGLWHEVALNDAIYHVIARPIVAGPTTNGWALVIHDGTKEREIQQRAQQQERLASVGQLAAGIAHDFNNVMTIIALYVDLVQLSEKGLSAHGVNRLNMISQQANRAADLIQQILDFSRCAVLERRPLDLLSFLKEVVKLLQRTLVESVTIEVVHTASRYTVNADPTRMQQMIVNLALNARDAMPKGGRLQFGLAEIWVDGLETAPLAEMQPGLWVKLSVSDVGNGIPPDVLPHIFDPFFTTKESGAGTGLGLAQVWGIVKQHEGHIDVASQPGAGTVFTVYLPHHGQVTAVSPDVEETVLPSGHQETILLVEDNPLTRQALMDSLLMMDYQVMTAGNGREALDILDTRPENLVLVVSDVIMPEMGGISLVHEIQRRHLPVSVLLLTGHPQDDELDQFQQQPGVQWLPKPISLEQLAGAVTEILLHHQA